jgi:hypothetical protein
MKATAIAIRLVLLVSAVCLPASAASLAWAAERADVEAVTVTWQSGSPLPQALAALGVVVNSGKLITLGGQNATGQTGTPVADVYNVAIGSGVPGTWSSGGSLDQPTSSHGVVLVDGRVYVIGGRSGSSASANVRYALVDGAGNVANWRQTESLPKKSSLAGTAVSGGVIYVAGGYDGSSERSEVYYARIGAGGVLSNWQSANSLPGALRGLTLTAANGYLYSVGGSDGNNVSAHVNRARINADGSLGAWQQLADLPQPRERHATAVYNGRLVVIGGLSAGLTSTNTVYAATLNADGSLGAWQTGFLPSLPQPLDRHAAVVVNVLGCGDVIYLVGGRNGDAYQSSVYYTTCAGFSVQKTYLPMARRDETLPPGIYGRITQSGAGVSSVAVDLHFYNGAQWSDVQRVLTDASGNYFFPGVAPLSGGQKYNVAYTNQESNSARLAYVQSYAILSYAGGRISGGDLEVKNVFHDSPADGSTVMLPATFCWQTRGVSGDVYYLVLEDQAQQVYWFAAGSSSCFQLDELPIGFQYGQTVHWSIGVENTPADNYEWGISYYYRQVTFQPSASEIYGHATENLAAASNVRIDLDYSPDGGSSWSNRAQVYTDASGKYSFASPPVLATGEAYNVAYYNPEDNSSRLGYCQKYFITDYPGGALWGGDFEIKNVAMQSPGGGASVTLPAQFCWYSRGIPGDNYYLLLQDPSEFGAWWYNAGADNCYTISALPPGWQFGVQYRWLVGVENNPQDENDWCISYYYRTVTFQPGASSPASADETPDYRRPREGVEHMIDRNE